jgi:light-regulated signal transduction histidine kinase (bacteriophytochrome)
VLKKKGEELKTLDKEFISFSYVSSNDLQEPLRKIQTFSSRILEKELDNLSEKGKEYFARMQRAANRMQRIIDDLVVFSQLNLDHKKFETVHINELVKELEGSLKEQIAEKKAIIEYGDLGRVNIIRNQFRQLLSNLMTNSLKFAKQDERLRITITSRRAKGSRLGNELLEKNRTYYHLQFADNGIGFESRFCERIFEVFQRLHGQEDFEGTGIGLAICKKIVENHHGIICGDGQLDKGSTFDIYLPLV